MDLILKTEHGEAITVTSNIETYDLEKRLAAMQVILDIINAVKSAQRGSICTNCSSKRTVINWADAGGTEYLCKHCNNKWYVEA